MNIYIYTHIYVQDQAFKVFAIEVNEVRGRRDTVISTWSKIRWMLHLS